jgi:hypothetical protein
LDYTASVYFLILPICSKGKYWEIIKLDMIDFAKQEKGKVEDRLLEVRRPKPEDRGQKSLCFGTPGGQKLQPTKESD